MYLSFRGYIEIDTLLMPHASEIDARTTRCARIQLYIYILRIEPVGEPYREVCQSPWKGNWQMSSNRIVGEMFCYKRKKLSWRYKEEWKHVIVYNPKRPPRPTLWPQRSRWPLLSVWPSLWPQKVTGSLEVAVTYFMTPKVRVTFVVSLT